MRKNIALILIFVYGYSYSQSVNDYKYAVVLSKFEFLKTNDEYNLNTLTKLLMGKYGFKAYLDTDILADDITNCNKINVDVISNGNLFITKLKVVLTDCKKNILFTSAEGRSKSKEYKVAYNEALRSAFESFNILHYRYNPAGKISKEFLESNELVLTNNHLIPLFAQSIPNGFQLVDSLSKVIMKIFATSNTNYFIAEKENVHGVLFAYNSQWFFEYYQNGKLISDKVDVKF